jgi:hypothetical protein
MLFLAVLFVFGGRGLATLLLFLYVTEEAGRKCVRYTMAASRPNAI